MEAEIITYKGITFRRYPNSPRFTDRNYFRPAYRFKRAGADYLHREVWKDHNGPIPDGCEIHHRDGDPSNNDPSNLECLAPSDHKARHDPPPAWLIEFRRANAGRIRPLSVSWHRSEEGRAWHRQHGRDAWQRRQTETRTCAQCGADFESITLRPSDRYCSNRCKSAHRRASGVDDEERTCPVCGVVFRVNRYAKTITCSRLCGAKVRPPR